MARPSSDAIVLVRLARSSLAMMGKAMCRSVKAA